MEEQQDKSPTGTVPASKEVLKDQPSCRAAPLTPSSLEYSYVESGEDLNRAFDVLLTELIRIEEQK